MGDCETHIMQHVTHPHLGEDLDAVLDAVGQAGSVQVAHGQQLPRGVCETAAVDPLLYLAQVHGHKLNLVSARCEEKVTGSMC